MKVQRIPVYERSKNHNHPCAFCFHHFLNISFKRQQTNQNISSKREKNISHYNQVMVNMK